MWGGASGLPPKKVGSSCCITGSVEAAGPGTGIYHHSDSGSHRRKSTNLSSSQDPEAKQRFTDMIREAWTAELKQLLAAALDEHRLALLAALQRNTDEQHAEVRQMILDAPSHLGGQTSIACNMKTAQSIMPTTMPSPPWLVPTKQAVDTDVGTPQKGDKAATPQYTGWPPSPPKDLSTSMDDNLQSDVAKAVALQSMAKAPPEPTLINVALGARPIGALERLERTNSAESSRIRTSAEKRADLHTAFKTTKGWHGDNAVAFDMEHSITKKHPGPSLDQKMKRFLERPGFDIFVGILIVANTLIMCAQVEYQGAIAGTALGVRDFVGWYGADSWFTSLEHGFNVIFITELFIRIAVLRSHFFSQKSNWLDVIIVFSSALDTYILGLLNVGVDMNLSFARLLRFGRIVRVLRIVRVMTVFKQLRILCKTILSSIGALVWSMLILFIIMIISALFLCQTLDDYIMDERNPDAIRLWVYQRYGSATRATYTMFEITLSGGWPQYARPLIEDVNPMFAGFFAIYVSAVVFAIIRIITALFLKETLQVAGQDQEMMVAEQMRRKNTYADKLRHVFEEADTSGDGMVSYDEFQTVLDDEEFKAVLTMLDLQVHEVSGLFDLLDDGDGCISFEEFVSGVVRLKGQAQAVDVVTILYENQKMVRKLQLIHQKVFWLCELSGGCRVPGTGSTNLS